MESTPLPEDERDLAENLMLACASCHTEIDKLAVSDLLDRDFLKSRKDEHENEIRHQTGLGSSRRTTILRVAGDIRGARVELPREAAILAVVKSGHRFPVFLESFDQKSIEVDLRHIDGEQEPTATYYDSAMATLTRTIELRVKPAILANEIQHLSVFAIARLPLLVFLGTQLDDAIAVDVYQRNRRLEVWTWPANGGEIEFTVTPVRAGTDENVVLIVNLSGTTPLSDLPDQLANSPVFELAPSSSAQDEDLFQPPETLSNFESIVRSFFTNLEATHKSATKVHLFGAIPVSPAVVFGRSLKSRGIRPSVVTYDRSEYGYTPAIEV